MPLSVLLCAHGIFSRAPIISLPTFLHTRSSSLPSRESSSQIIFSSERYINTVDVFDELLLTFPQGYYQIKDLYSARKRSPYYYSFGFNWRAYTAYIAGILINIVGFVGAIGVEVPVGAQYIYNLNFFCGFIVASSTYYLLCKLSPVPATSDVWMEVGDEIIDPSLAYDESDFDEEGRVGGKGELVEENVVGKDLKDF